LAIAKVEHVWCRASIGGGRHRHIERNEPLVKLHRSEGALPCALVIVRLLFCTAKGIILDMLLRQTLPVERDFAEVQWLLQEVQTWSYQELDHRENKLTVFTLPFFDGCTGDHNQQHSELPHEHVIDDRSAGEENRGGPQQGSRRRSMHSMNMAYEREFGEQLARITRSVESPSEAELLYVPACLSTV